MAFTNTEHIEVYKNKLMSKYTTHQHKAEGKDTIVWAPVGPCGPLWAPVGSFDCPVVWREHLHGFIS